MSGSDADRRQPEPDDGNLWWLVGLFAFLLFAGYMLYDAVN